MQWSTRAKPELRPAAAGLEGRDAHPAKPTQEADAIAPARCPHAGRNVRCGWIPPDRSAVSDRHGCADETPERWLGAACGIERDRAEARGRQGP